MPLSLCADLAIKILRMTQNVEDAQLKTRVYLTLEVLYASRRFVSGDHTEQMVIALLES